MTKKYQIIDETGFPIGTFDTLEHAQRALLHIKVGKIREVDV